MNVEMTEVLALLEIDPPNRVPGHIYCTLHEENTPSLCIYEDGWWCYGCGQGGSPIDFIMKQMGCSFGRALAYLRSGIDDFDERPPRGHREPAGPIDLTETFERESQSPWPKAATFYADTTWPHLATPISAPPFDDPPFVRLHAWGVRPASYYLMIPHRDANGRIVGVKTRTHTGGNKGAKRSFPGSSYPLLYSVESRPDADNVWLVEGESDTWTMTLQHPADQVYGLPSGAMTWRLEYAEQLLKHRCVWVALDNDDTGNRAAERISSLLPPQRRVSRVSSPDPYKDWTERAVAEWNERHR